MFPIRAERYPPGVLGEAIFDVLGEKASPAKYVELNGAAVGIQEVYGVKQRDLAAGRVKCDVKAPIPLATKLFLVVGSQI